MKRAALVTAVVLSLVACGTGSPTSVILRSNSRFVPVVYLQITGSSDAARNSIAVMLEHAWGGGGLVAAPAVQGEQVCTRAIPIVTYPVTVPNLRRLGDQKITLVLYGDHRIGTTYCAHIAGEFSGGLPVVGGNRRINFMPSPNMEPTIHCGTKGIGCRGQADDLFVTQLTGARRLTRGAIVLFNPPPKAVEMCGNPNGFYVNRVIALPGETVRADEGFIWVRSPGSAAWTKMGETNIPAAPTQRRRVPAGEYFLVGDYRADVCDSRDWGPVSAANIIGPVVDVIRGGRVLKPAGIPS